MPNLLSVVRGPRSLITVTTGAAPVAFRLRRPYNTEEEFLAGDGHAISRTGMILIGAGPRPSGLIVRFEVALRDGSVIFRGEGKVVVHRAAAQDGRAAGLEIRFSRLDVRGKALVDRVTKGRDPEPPRSPSQGPPPGSMPPSASLSASSPASIPPLSMPRSIDIPPLFPEEGVESIRSMAPVELLPVSVGRPPSDFPPEPAVPDEPTIAMAVPVPAPTPRSASETEAAPAPQAAPEPRGQPEPQAAPEPGRQVSPREAALARLRGRQAASVPPVGGERDAALGRLRGRG